MRAMRDHRLVHVIRFRSTAPRAPRRAFIPAPAFHTLLHSQAAMAAIASFQGVKVVTKARAAKVNVRAAPVANLQKASKVRAAATGLCRVRRPTGL